MRISPDHLLTTGACAQKSLPREMIDREKVVAILTKRFPGASTQQIAEAANGIVGLTGEWREVENFEASMEQHLRDCNCPDAAWFVRRFAEGSRYKLFEHVDNG